MEEQQVFVLAEGAVKEVVRQIGKDQWEMALPAEFRRQGSDEVPTVRSVVNALAYDDAWVPDMLAGRTMEEVGKDAHSGDLLGEHPGPSFDAIMERACAAARTLEDLERTVHCSFGDYSAREYFWQINSYRALRAYDLARALDLEVTLPEQLVQGVWDEVSPVAEEWRSYGVFPQAVPVPAGDPLLDRLLGLTGRQPRSR